MNVKALGAKGDGVADDTAVLNSILAGAANTSSIVHFPHGVYKVTDTLRVPIGSRIVGQAWSQIMGTGEKFADEASPRPVVRVADPGDVGIVEIQDMLFTVSGPTAGAIVLQWNAQESTQGSAGMWDTHVRVGGAVGSNLQASDCPKQLNGEIKPECKAAFMMIYLTPGSTAYLENFWAWTADHDLDTPERKQVNMYTGRGMLIESRLAYLWGTSVEHATLYQYQLSNARNILLSTIQSETPYFQPMNNSPQPYRTGLFPGDPSFDHCEEGGNRCAMAWGTRIIDSETVYMLSAGIYSWFNNYDQECLGTDSCQQRGVDVEQSGDIWLYNLCTKAMVELISPHNEQPTLAADNRNGLLSSVLAWVRGTGDTSGPRDFPGFRVYVADEVEFMPTNDLCKLALSSLVKCHDEVQDFQSLAYRASLGNNTLTNLVCQKSCGDSLAAWVSNVDRACNPDATGNGPPVLHGARMYAGWNETCLQDPASGQRCNDVIDRFTPVSTIEDMPSSELCSFCHVERLAMMQRTPYSSYDDFWKTQLEHIYCTCDTADGPTDVQLPDLGLPEDGRDSDFCLTGNWYTTTKEGESCEEIAWEHTTSSAWLFMANQARIISCAAGDTIPAGTRLCIPPGCGKSYMLQDHDTCASIERNATLSLSPGDVARFNPWVGFECARMQEFSISYGAVICLGLLFGGYDPRVPDGGQGATRPPVNDGYSNVIVPPPEGSQVAEGTTLSCGRWYKAEADDSCVVICMANSIDAQLLVRANPSLGSDLDACTSKIKEGLTYCVSPYRDWESNNGEL